MAIDGFCVISESFLLENTFPFCISHSQMTKTQLTQRILVHFYTFFLMAVIRYYLRKVFVHIYIFSSMVVYGYIFFIYFWRIHCNSRGQIVKKVRMQALFGTHAHFCSYLNHIFQMAVYRHNCELYF